MDKQCFRKVKAVTIVRDALKLRLRSCLIYFGRKIYHTSSKHMNTQKLKKIVIFFRKKMFVKIIPEDGRHDVRILYSPLAGVNLIPAIRYENQGFP